MTDPAPIEKTMPVIPHTGDFRWQDVPVKEYKTEGTNFRDITRQTLFDDPDLECELRYFQVEPNGHSSLERHEHVHAVLILRGRGRVLVDREIYDVNPFDLVYVPPLTWHQFQASADEPLGFLCLVNCERDRPQVPTEDELAGLRGDPQLAQWIRV